MNNYGEIIQSFVELLIKTGYTISTAESCTGGFIANELTNYTGSSAFFKASFILYSKQIKNEILSIAERDIQKYGVYSSHVAELMAKRAKDLTHTDICLSTTGIAPPGDKSTNMETGLVFIGLAIGSTVKSIKYLSDKKIRSDFKRDVALHGIKALIHEIDRKK